MQCETPNFYGPRHIPLVGKGGPQVDRAAVELNSCRKGLFARVKPSTQLMSALVPLVELGVLRHAGYDTPKAHGLLCRQMLRDLRPLAARGKAPWD